MKNLWELPRRLSIGGREVEIDPDFRTVLQIFRHFQNEELPEFLRWEVALRLFYRQIVPEQQEYAAMEALADFIRCGAQDSPGPKLLDWQQDAAIIIADVNKAAGQELRSLPFVHWWTFLGWFHAIGQGQLSTVVAIRQKLQGKQKLEPWEQDFYRQNKAMVDMKAPLTEEEQAEKDRLNQLLGN